MGDLFSLLLVIEYTGYYILEIRQVTLEGPLIFGLIHGPPILKAYYIAAGVGTILLRRLLDRIVASLGGRRIFYRKKSITTNSYEYNNGKGLDKAL